MTERPNGSSDREARDGYSSGTWLAETSGCIGGKRRRSCDAWPSSRKMAEKRTLRADCGFFPSGAESAVGGGATSAEKSGPLAATMGTAASRGGWAASGSTSATRRAPARGAQSVAGRRSAAGSRCARVWGPLAVELETGGVCVWLTRRTRSPSPLLRTQSARRARRTARTPTTASARCPQ